MRTQYLRLRPGVHRAIDNHAVARCLRRQLKNPLVTVYYHERLGHYVIASWVSKKYKLVVEHVPFGGKSGFSVQTAMDCVRLQLCKSTTQVLRGLRDAAWREVSDESADAQAEHDEHLDHREWMRRHARKHYRDHPVWNYW